MAEGQKSSAELREELKEAERREREAADRLAASVRPVWRFTLLPSDEKFDKVWDESVLKYRLQGEIQNREELELVNNPMRNDGGGMTYLFNTLSKRLVMSTGGGTMWLSEGWGNNEDAIESARIARRELEFFLDLQPEGGDVTQIIEDHRKRMNRA